MKKLGIIVCSLAALAMSFTSCKPKDPTPQDDPVIVEDGFYVIGEATVVTDFKAANAAIELMGQGFNEVDKQYRKGMYEKYIALEGGKDFELVLYEAGTETHYGADLEEGEVETDATAVMAQKGKLAQNIKMSVPANGFYHIILDLNLNEDLPDGAQIIVVPCEWGVRGAMNAWDYTALKAGEFNKQTMTWTLKDVLVTSDGQFKFAHGKCWKYNLDKQEKVKAENSLGITGSNDGAEECVPATKLFGGGKNFAIAAGLYDITLTWNLKAGAVGESFVGEAKRTGDVPFQDYSEVQLELVGSAIADQAGAEADDIWTWGNKMAIGKPTLDGDVFSWKKEHVQLIGGEGFKVRTLGYAAQGEFVAFDFGKDGGSDNASVAADGVYTITATINGATGAKNLIIDAE